MLGREEWYMIRELRAQGVYLRDIARRLGVHPRTVRRTLERNGPPSRSRRRGKFVKLTPYMATVDRYLGDDVWNAVVIYRELQQLGYRGKLTTLREYIQPKRTIRPSLATVRFETEPGQQLQGDWSKIVTQIAGVRQPIQVAVNTLGYSRRFHFFAAPCNDAEHTYESLVRSFAWFGGVTREVLVDNQKTAVIEHRIGEAVRFNERFLDFADYYGFRPRACRPYRARTKGKDERMVRYVKEHFFVRYRQFESLAHLNQVAEQWLLEEADQRYHGTVKEVVAERFERERAHLLPLPQVSYDTSYLETRWVSWDGYISVRGNRYSVPAPCCGQPVTVRIALDGYLRVFDAQSRLVATHRQRPAEEGWVTIPAHHEILWSNSGLHVEQRPLSVYEEVLPWS